MPCFITHWGVAVGAINSAPPYVVEGYKEYVALAQAYRVELEGFKDAILRRPKLGDWLEELPAGTSLPVDPNVADARLARTAGLIALKLTQLTRRYEDSIRTSRSLDQMCCFSAYTLGACGPDFWMLPVDQASWTKLKPLMAPLHFDLGHYNRTHAQFRSFLAFLLRTPRAIEGTELSRWGKLAASYFYGMATHYAADLHLHELVNVTAGAYSLLEPEWTFEHSAFHSVPSIFNVFNTHNKIEHYWDSYVRLRYMSNYGPVFGESDRDLAAFQPLGFPSCDRMAEDLRKAAGDHWYGWDNEMARVLHDMLEGKSPFDYRYVLQLEACQNLPQLACDRIGTRDFPHFLYDVYVDKTNGAYPSALVPQAVTTEAARGDRQFADKEASKLWFFAKKPNTEAYKDELWASSTNAFLTYWAFPRLARVKEYGWRVFYDPRDLVPFAEAAKAAAGKFMDALSGGIKAVLGRQVDLGTLERLPLDPLDRFWNLDTGLGLQVTSVYSDTPKEVITKLKFGHVVDWVNMGRTSCGHDPTYTNDMKVANYTEPRGSFPLQPVQAGKPVANLAEVTDPGGGAYLDRIRITGGTTCRVGGVIDRYFDPEPPPMLRPALAVTDTLTEGKANEVRVSDALTRLSLVFETAIVDLYSAQEDLAFYLVNDDRTAQNESVALQGEHVPGRWLHGEMKTAGGVIHQVKDLDYVEISGTKHEVKRRGVQAVRRDERLNVSRFRSQVLMNLELDEAQSSEPRFVNRIELASLPAPIGRNFAIGTGRRNVLHPRGDGDFWANRDFSVYKNLSPTEHVFVSLVVLVKDCRTPQPTIYDLFSRAPVTKTDLTTTLKKIDCVNFVKVVLFYKVFPDGGTQLQECLIDGDVSAVKSEEYSEEV